MLPAGSLFHFQNNVRSALTLEQILSIVLLSADGHTNAGSDMISRYDCIIIILYRTSV